MPILGERDGVESDRQHLREIDPIVEGEPAREKLRQSIGRGERGELRMTPVAEDPRPFAHSIPMSPAYPIPASAEKICVKSMCPAPGSNRCESAICT